MNTEMCLVGITVEGVRLACLQRESESSKTTFRGGVLKITINHGSIPVPPDLAAAVIDCVEVGLKVLR